MTPSTRRQFIQRAALGGAATLALPSLASAATRSAQADAKTLTISNWPLYIDIDEKTKKRPSLEAFTKKTGIKVKYLEDVNDNNSFYGKVAPLLRRGQSIDRDIVVLTDWMAARLVRAGWVEKLDRAKIPNARNLQPGLRHPSWDKNREYSLPWMTFMAGIGYDPKRVGYEITSVDQLLTDKKLRGKVTLLSELPETTGLVMLSNGDNPEQVTDASFDRAVKKIQKALDSGQIRQFTGNDYGPLLAKGDVLAAFAWSGDVVQLQIDNPGLKFAIPSAGGIMLSDNMLIPKKGNVELASQFMNFVYDPAVFAGIVDYVSYPSPVMGIEKTLARTDPAILKNGLVFPDAKTRARLRSYDPVAADNKDYKEMFQALVGA